MNRQLIEKAIEAPTDESIQALLNDRDSVFWVDWREEDDAIIEYCESIIKTGVLSAELVDTDNEAGFDLYIDYKGTRVKVPLVIGPEDRHITICSLNDLLKPDYEIRFCVDSACGDTLAFLPLAASDWRALESRYGTAINERFIRITAKPNLFTGT
jgi:hypothetical protein